jgi:hypothetical protein
MPRQDRKTRNILMAVERSGEHSSLFYWMVEHHDEMIASSKRKRIKWADFCARAAEKGLTDLTGKPASEPTARQTWLRARRHVAIDRAAEAAKTPMPVHPSRMSKDWRPSAAPPPAPAVNPTGAPIGKQKSSIRKEEPEDDAPYDPDEQIAHLIRTVRKRG